MLGALTRPAADGRGQLGQHPRGPLEHKAPAWSQPVVATADGQRGQGGTDPLGLLDQVEHVPASRGAHQRVGIAEHVAGGQLAGTGRDLPAGGCVHRVACQSGERGGQRRPLRAAPVDRPRGDDEKALP